MRDDSCELPPPVCTLLASRTLDDLLVIHAERGGDVARLLEAATTAWVDGGRRGTAPICTFADALFTKASPAEGAPCRAARAVKEAHTGLLAAAPTPGCADQGLPRGRGGTEQRQRGGASCAPAGPPCPTAGAGATVAAAASAGGGATAHHHPAYAGLPRQAGAPAAACPLLLGQALPAARPRPRVPLLPHAGAGPWRPWLPHRSLRTGSVTLCHPAQPIRLAHRPPPASGLRRGHRRRQPGSCAAPLQPLQAGQVGAAAPAAAMRGCAAVGLVVALRAQPPAAQLHVPPHRRKCPAPLPLAASSTRSCTAATS